MSPQHPPQDADLAICESEPLAWIGSIQSQGVLIVTDKNGQLLRYSSNISRHFAFDETTINSAVIDDFFEDRTSYFSYREYPLFEDSHFLIKDVTTNSGVSGDLVLSHHADYRFYEFEPKHQLSSKADLADVSVDCLPGALAEQMSELLRRAYELTGYGKIMIYRFLEDETGEVVGELSDGRLDSYLGLRFPAADVPRIARALYAKNPYRVIFDVDGEVVPMRPIPGMDDAVDLTSASLRAVSPIHLEYLRNMSVQSSASFSIRVTGKLWGLLALHAVEPKAIPVQNRAVIREQVDLLQASLQDRQIKEDYRRFNASADQIESLTQRLAATVKTGSSLSIPDGFESSISCDNLLILVKGEVVYRLKPIEQSRVDIVLQLARGEANMGQFTTESLQTVVEQSDDFRRQISGVLYEGTGGRGEADAPSAELIWLREEDAVNVNWAGNPAKIREEIDGQVRISPRRSFEKWSEISRGRSTSWSSTDKQLASRILGQLVNRIRR